MKTKGLLWVLRPVAFGLVFALVLGATNALADNHPQVPALKWSADAVSSGMVTVWFGGVPSANQFARVREISPSTGSSQIKRVKQISGRDSVAGGADGGAGDNAAGVCNAATAERQCLQANFGLDSGAGIFSQINQISGRDSVAGGANGGDGNNASGVCNAATAERQCLQANFGLDTGGGILSQINQISGRDSVAGQASAAAGDNASGVCNAATAERQCLQANIGLVAGAAGEVSQVNQISGRDSVAGGTAGGSGNNAAGVCNAATAEHQCEQKNVAQVAQSDGTGSTGTVSQTNQISGRDSVAGGADGGGGNNAAGVCNAATAVHQCEQENVAQVVQSDGAGNTGTVSQTNQISGQGVCNAATAEHQCNQTNVAEIGQSGGANNAATVSQANQISGQDACNADTAEHQCEQTNVAKIEQSGGANNTASVSQANQISGQGVCNAATAEHQCVQTSVAEIEQSGSANNAASVSQSSQISTRVTVGG